MTGEGGDRLAALDGMKINILKTGVFSGKDGGVTGLSTVGKNIVFLLFLPTTDRGEPRESSTLYTR